MATYQGGSDGLGIAALQFVTTGSFPTNTTPVAVAVQPQPQLASPGGTATFSVVVTGPGASYQWFKIDTAIPDGTSSSYSTPPLSLTDDGANSYNWDVDTLKRSPLWSYCGDSAGIWRCPADSQFPCIPAAGPLKGLAQPRVRSMSMLSWFNGIDADDPGLGGVGRIEYQKLTQVLNPGPAMTILFLDERCDSINDGEWCTSMYGWPDGPSQWKLIDFPASYHGGAGGLSFVDGHSEIHKWKDPRTTPPVGRVFNLNIPSPNNVDVYWTMERSTRRR